MTRANFGDRLRQARKRKGMDLRAAADRLKVRPDVLRAIEECDFDRMPPRSYTRNMLRSYARLVGLDPQAVAQSYAEEIRLQSAGADDGRSDERASHESERRSSGRGASDRSRRRGGSGRRRASGARPAADGEPRSRRGADGRSAGRGSAPVRQTETWPRFANVLQGAETVFSKRSPSSGGVPYANLYSGHKQGGPKFNPLALVAVAVIIILLIVVIYLALGAGAHNQESDIPDVPVTGLTDTTKIDEQANSDQKKSDAASDSSAAPQKATFQYSVSDGDEVYIEIYENGSDTASFADTVAGPAKQSFDVTDTLKFVTTYPDYVKTTVDGKDVKPADKNGDGVYEYTVDFPSILKKWKKKNGGQDDTSKKSSSSAGDASAADDAASGNASTDSSASDASSDAASSATDESVQSDGGIQSDSQDAALSE